MKYFNWQKIHKEAYSPKYHWNLVLDTSATSSAALPVETIQTRAWQELTLSCTPRELAHLLRLAHQYDIGERLHDTSILDENFR